MELQKDCGSSEKRQPINYSQKNNLNPDRNIKIPGFLTLQENVNILIIDCKKVRPEIGFLMLFLDFDILMPFDVLFSENLRKTVKSNFFFVMQQKKSPFFSIFFVFLG